MYTFTFYTISSLYVSLLRLTYTAINSKQGLFYTDYTIRVGTYMDMGSKLQMEAQSSCPTVRR